MPVYEWGVDSAQNVTEDLFQCVISNLGYPIFWGRYLVRVSGISEGLTKKEILLIQSEGVKLLPIYNAFQKAEGYIQGRAAADHAIFHARKLGIPEGVPLFANLEKFFRIDKEWIRGWSEGMVIGGYKSGFYNDPVIGGFNEAFCNAVKENEAIRKLTILWSAQPELEPGGPRDAPRYNPKTPACGGNVWVWQYSRRVTQCPVDSNLADSRLVNMLW